MSAPKMVAKITAEPAAAGQQGYPGLLEGLYLVMPVQTAAEFESQEFAALIVVAARVSPGRGPGVCRKKGLFR